jgi:hypothetical protein
MYDNSFKLINRGNKMVPKYIEEAFKKEDEALQSLLNFIDVELALVVKREEQFKKMYSHRVSNV